ncbi:hypothetical protein ABZW47_31775 [Streptomyces sp. NPDC004549]|uniref:hypothetical protein n=1 Tax=Streptomyces sp. NPDC004549 TaxID=3154283 RepID=UPI0033BDD57C
MPLHDFPRIYAFHVPRNDERLHRRLIEDPPRYSTEWNPPAGTELHWGDRIVFGSTADIGPAQPGDWANTAIRFRVFTVSPFDTVRHPTGIPLVGGHDEHERPGAELGELTEALRLSAAQGVPRPLYVPPWLKFAIN